MKKTKWIRSTRTKNANDFLRGGGNKDDLIKSLLSQLNESDSIIRELVAKSEKTFIIKKQQ